MNVRFIHTKFGLILICLLIYFLKTNGQAVDSLPKKDSTVRSIIDTSNTIVNNAKRFAEAEIKESAKDYKQDIFATRQYELLEAIKKEIFEAKGFVKRGIDTVGFTNEINKINKWFNISGDGIFINTGTSQTFRNLTTSQILVKELLERLTARKVELDSYYKNLVTFRNRIDSFATDSALFAAPVDSEKVVQYFTNLIMAARELAPADSILEDAIRNIQHLQMRVNTLKNALTVSFENIENFQYKLSEKTFKRDFSNLGDAVKFSRPFKSILYFSAVKTSLSLKFYVTNNIGKILLLLLLIGLSFSFLKSLKARWNEEHTQKDLTGLLVLRYPLLSAILLVITLFQFIFITPPFIFNFILWTISGVALTIIFRGFISKYWMKVWLTFFTFFILGSLLNFILQASRTERWMMLALSVTGFLITTLVVATSKKNIPKEKWIIYFIALTAVIELVSSIANIYGRYNFSKMLLTTGYFNVLIGILFLWVVRLINEGLSLAHDLYTIPDKKLFYINFDRIGNKAPFFLNVLLVIGWFILFGRNFYVFNLITNPVQKILFKERSIGEYSFSLESVLLFFGILVLAALISKIVSFFATDQHDVVSTKTKGVGSWLLLIRISIVSLGLFFAFAATGIPVDKITIILGALSVGIGFGLQTLINNLVSGLIISFEKPVNVGDIVEVAGNSGVMKSIGFRSSVIYTWDGADIIIPNGDLLNQHLVNWTLGNNNRRVIIPVGVAYGTDLEKTKKILLALTLEDDRILQSPTPSVQITNFNNSSIDLLLKFWVRDIREWVAASSDMMLAIDIAFKDNNIQIPFPQQDLHIRSDDRVKPSAQNDKTVQPPPGNPNI